MSTQNGPKYWESLMINQVQLLSCAYIQKMSGLNSGVEHIEGLSKRQQSKLERLIKSDVTSKSHTHAKSYKRKTGKGKPIDEANQRKLIKVTDIIYQLQTQNPYPSDQSQSESSPVSQKLKKQNQQAAHPTKKRLKLLKPLNPKFPLGNGQQSLFDYIMTYSYTERQKKIDGPVEEINFLDKCDGLALQIVNSSSMTRRKQKVSQQFERIKQQIQMPFDEIHRSFTKRIADKNFFSK